MGIVVRVAMKATVQLKSSHQIGLLKFLSSDCIKALNRRVGFGFEPYITNNHVFTNTAIANQHFLVGKKPSAC